ncbi:MAG TPA: DUF58 domain-containing protein [Solirubrobacteraceae bacterium]
MPRPLLDALDIALSRRVSRTLPGERRAPGVGAGTELSQIRPYTIGDDTRHLDPAATARTGEPHVRLHVPERTLTTWVVLDVSPSMAFGTSQRLKADVAEGAALAVARLAVRRAGAVGLVRFGDGQIRVSPPRGAKAGMVSVRRSLEDGVVPDGGGDPRALAEALARLGKIVRGNGLVVVISDFRDHEGWASPLGALRARHSMLAIEVVDPREQAMPNLGVLAVVDPESGRLVQVNTARRRVRERFAALETERRTEVARELKRLRVDHVTLSTEGDWLAELGRRLR